MDLILVTVGGVPAAALMMGMGALLVRAAEALLVGDVVEAAEREA